MKKSKKKHEEERWRGKETNRLAASVGKKN